VRSLFSSLSEGPTDTPIPIAEPLYVSWFRISVAARVPDPKLLALISRRQKRLYIAARNTLEIHKPAIYHDNIEKILTEVRKSRSLSDCVVGADGLEPPTLSV